MSTTPEDHTGVDFSIDFPGTRGIARFSKAVIALHGEGDAKYV